METRLLKKQMTTAYQFSFVRMVLNYYTLFETISEETAVPKRIFAYCKQLNELLEEYFSGKIVEEDLLCLRKNITHEMEVLTSYTDCFQIYEYVLNRIERKFKALPAIGYSDEAYTKRLVSFISDSKESTVMNGRIMQIVGQLPVRLTKQKFFSLVMEGLSVYIGSPRESLHDMMYTLGTEAMTKLPIDMAEGHKEYYEILERCHGINYRNMNEKAYEQATADLSFACEALVAESGLYVMLQDIINDLCVLLFARTEAVIEVKEEEFYASMVKEIHEKFSKEDYTSVKENFFDRLTQLEGRQEACYERYLRLELPEENEELNKDPDFIKAVNVDRLLSGSSFVQLKERNEETALAKDEVLVDRPYLEKVTKEYFVELEKKFSETSRPVVRAIMAKVLSDLPIYFHSIDEIESYIRGSLESCLDQAEKETCKELLEKLMDYENKLV